MIKVNDDGVNPRRPFPDVFEALALLASLGLIILAAALSFL